MRSDAEQKKLEDLRKESHKILKELRDAAINMGDAFRRREDREGQDYHRKMMDIGSRYYVNHLKIQTVLGKYRGPLPGGETV